MDRSECLALPMTLQRFLDLFIASVPLTSAARAQDGKPLGLAAASSKESEQAGELRQRATDRDGETLTDAQAAAVRELLPAWLHLLYAASTAPSATAAEPHSLSEAEIDPARTEGNSKAERVEGTSSASSAASRASSHGPAKNVSETRLLPRGTERQGEGCASGGGLPGLRHGLMALPKAVEETAFASARLALIPAARVPSAAAGSGERPTARSPHAVLPPCRLDHAILSAFLHANRDTSRRDDEKGDGTELSDAFGRERWDWMAPLAHVASLSWLHYSWVHLMLLAHVSRPDTRRKAEDDGAPVKDGGQLVLDAADTFAGAFATAAAEEAARDGAMSATGQPTISHRGLAAVMDRVAAGEPRLRVSALASVFFHECCRVAAGGEAASFATAHVPLPVLLRIGQFLHRRVRACAVGGRVPQTPRSTDGQALEAAEVGVLAAVALRHPLTGMRLVKRPRASRASHARTPPPPKWRPPAAEERCAPQAQLPQQPREPHLSPADVPVGSVDAISVGDTSSSSNSSSSTYDDDEEVEEGEGGNVGEVAEGSLDGGDEWVDDLAGMGSRDTDGVSIISVSSSSSHRSGALSDGAEEARSSGGDVSGAPFVQCESPLASLLFSFSRRGRGREVHGRVGDLSWCLCAGSQAHLRQLLSRRPDAE